MASRYGRNQRRKHRSEIELLRAANDTLTANLFTAIGASDKQLSMMAIVAGRVVLLDWKYALSDRILREGITDAEAIHIAEQVAVKFYERMKAELHGWKPEGREARGSAQDAGAEQAEVRPDDGQDQKQA